MKILTAVLLVTLLILQLRLWVGEGSLGQVKSLEHQIAEQRQVNEKLSERNAALETEVLDLKTGLEAVEERARTELGMIGEDEIFYQIIP